MNLLLSFRQVALAVAALTILGLGLPASAAPPVPFRGRADLVITGAEDLSPTSRRLTASATGQATHLGRFNADRDDRYQPNGWHFHRNAGVHRSQWRHAYRRPGGPLHVTPPRCGRGDVRVHG